MRRGFSQKWLRASSLALIVCALAGCVSPKPSEPGDETRWQPQLLYLNRAPHPALYVEVDAVEGTEPSDAVLEQLRQFLVKYCDKPGGVRIVREKPIPRDEARGLSHAELACGFLKGPPASCSNSWPAFMYVLYYDSRLSEDQGMMPYRRVHKHESLSYDFSWVSSIQPHVHILPFPGTIFMDRRYVAAAPHSLEGLLLMHEAGHLLGLTQNQKHGVGNHCTNKLCLMKPKLIVDMPRAVFSPQKTLQTNLCADCQADLHWGRTSAPPTNLHFVGPVLVRSEPGYHIATLPCQQKFFSGPVSKLNVAEFVQQMRQDRARGARREWWTRSWLDLNEPREEWPAQVAGLEHTKEDPLETVRQVSTNSVATAQYLLSQAYRRGDGLPKNEDKALQCLLKAAEAGKAEAQNALGLCYFQATGVPKDEDKAFAWFSKAADQGLPAAQNNLGAFYMQGAGVEKDPVAAARWFAKAAAGGDLDGQRNFGSALAEGAGVRRNEVEAYAWFSVGAQRGDKIAAAQIEKLNCRLTEKKQERAKIQAAALSRSSALKQTSE
ncbi:MAG: hypothetical protein C5B50_23465 [Verrucomicrobia bacterium]|nr:MAG: hypothetical protein C5B50_23465 [Verrucomicrobiota bacterium]